MRYCLSVVVDGVSKVLAGADIASAVAAMPYSADQIRHLSAIERLGARGCSYSNEDFDILSAAWHFAGCP